MPNFLVNSQSVLFDSMNSVVLTSFSYKAFKKKTDLFYKNVSNVLVGAELSWPLRTNAEAANEGCSSFYTAALRTHTLNSDL